MYSRRKHHHQKSQDPIQIQPVQDSSTTQDSDNLEHNIHILENDLDDRPIALRKEREHAHKTHWEFCLTLTVYPNYRAFLSNLDQVQVPSTIDETLN